MDSRTSEGRFDAAITMLSRPRLLLQGTVEYILAWSFTRGWWRLLLMHSLWMLLLVTTVGLVGYGVFISRQTLAQRYSDWVTEEIPEALRSADENSPVRTDNSEKKPAGIAEDPAVVDSTETGSTAPPTTDDTEQVSRYGELLLRRLLQLQDSNSRITYLVAAQLARKDRLAQARQMMRRIAPTDGGGFAPAHHWLAGDQLYFRQVRSPAERDQLIKDLSVATRWGGCHPALRTLYSQLLESQGNVPQAMAVLEPAIGADVGLEANLAIARLAAKHGLQGRFDRAAQEIKQEVEKKVVDGTVTSKDWSVLATLFLFQKQPEKARQAAEAGLKKEADDPQLRRMLSESYRVEYLMSIQQAGDQTKLKLGLLDAALKCDPTNPAVGTEIARLLSMGLDATPDLKNALEQQLAAGQATALTHILLANRQLVTGDLEAAKPHLELALRQAPNNPVVMNNLGLTLARLNQEMDRALQLAAAAVAGEPTNADFRDTLGEVRSRSGDKLGAIECYEASIGLNPKARSTREKLAGLYRELGMREMAEVQERELEKPVTAPSETQPSEQNTLEPGEETDKRPAQPTTADKLEQPAELQLEPSQPGELESNDKENQ